ncbi:MAG: hypothetical protein KBA53_12610 [Thermoclostridium sp.]|jgi:putative aldouronate transport system substrate-binding protein|nr:hypothetical protein [Thermoclostridium sp.]
MRKGVLAIFLFLFLFLCGCSSTESGDTVRIAIPDSPYIQNIDSNYYKLWLEKQTGINLEFVIVRQERSEEYLKTICSNTDADIDVVFFSSSAGFTLENELLEQYVNSGSFMKLDPFLTEDRYYASLLKQTGLIEALLFQDRGIYFFPHISRSRSDQNGQVLWLNYDWLKKLGLRLPTTADELKQVLISFAEDDPNGNGQADEIPLIGCDDEYSLQSCNFLLNAFICNDPYHSRVYSDNGILRYAPITDDFRKGLAYCHDLYELGVLDERSFTYTRNQLIQLSNSPEMVVGGFTSASIAQVLYQNNPEIMASFIHIPPLLGENGQQNALWVDNKPSCGAVILANSPKAEEAFHVLDTMLSEEASLIAEYGEPGVDWEYADGTSISLYGLPATLITKKYIRQTLQNKHFAGLGPLYLSESCIDGVTWNGVNSDTRYIDTRASMSYEAFYPDRRIFISDEPSVRKIRSALDEYTDRSIVEFITGILDVANNSQWQAFQDTCEALGVNDMLQQCMEVPR